MKKFLLSLALALGLAVSAQAQVNVVPQPGLITATLRQNTYSAISIGLVPAASATDFYCISGSATKLVIVRRVIISGTAGTAITTPIVFLVRHSLDTGGTPATSTALPVAAPLDTNNPAATAVLVAYTANPTIVDASPNYLYAPAVTFAVTTTANTPTSIAFGTNGADVFNQGIQLRGAAQQLCLNLNAASVSSGVLAITTEWTEQ